MSGRWRMGALLVWVWGCGVGLGCVTKVPQESEVPEQGPGQAPGQAPGEAPLPSTPVPDKGPQDLPDSGNEEEEPPRDSFRPIFYRSLRGSTEVPERTTYRFRIPVARAGSRLRFVFRAGDGPMRLHRASVARSDAEGGLASEPVVLSFQGEPGADVPAHRVVRSDPILLPVEFREELAISFEVEGAVATGEGALYPQSYATPGSFSLSMEGMGMSQALGLVGLRGIEMEVAPGCVAVMGGGGRAGGALGDVRETWPAVAERVLGVPVLDVAEALGGKAGEQRLLGLLRQCGEADCVVVPGEEDLAGRPAEELQATLSGLFERLGSVCELYAGTLPSPDKGPSARGAMNDWLRAHVPATRLFDFARERLDAGTREGRARMGIEVALRLKGPPVGELGGAFSLEVTYQDSQHEILAVDPRGTVYAVKPGDSRARLWASTDNARTWRVRGTHPSNAGFLKMTSLRDGTLLATVYSQGEFSLSRSTDHGVTWRAVLPLGQFRMLQPHSIRELRGTVFFIEYQTFTDTSPIRLWASTDKGATWKVRYIFQGRRHGHSLVADPAQGVLWAMMGDLRGGLLRSVDDGVTWYPVVDGALGVAVDGVITSRGLLFGSDNLYGPPMAEIRRVGNDEALVEVSGLPGPSYSIFQLPGGGYVLGTTRETSGDVYAPGDTSAHVLYSADGVTWQEFRSFPRLSETDYVRADVYWQLPSGELVLEVINSQELGSAGFLLLKAVRK